MPAKKHGIGTKFRVEGFKRGKVEELPPEKASWLPVRWPQTWHFLREFVMS